MKLCPKCNSGEITNTKDVYSMLGMAPETDKDYMCNNCNHLFNEEEAAGEAWYDINNLPSLKICQIADIVFEDWRKINQNALPYLEAMMDIENIDDMYKQDSAKSVVLYFLVNAQQWKGPVAREVKKYLKEKVDEQNKT